VREAGTRDSQEHNFVVIPGLRAAQNPESILLLLVPWLSRKWIPACAGMTNLVIRLAHS
jgi:hypothetical protein